MKQFLLSALALLLLASPAFAEFNGKAEYQEFILQNGAVSATPGTVAAVDRYSSIALNVTISSTATITFEGSVDGVNTSTMNCVNVFNSTVTSTASATGVYQCNVSGLRSFRARISSYTNGTVDVYARATTAILGGGGGGGAGGSTPMLAGCWATAAQPSYLEGTLNALSCTLNGLVRMTLETLLSGEDQTNNLLQTSGGAVRQDRVLSNVAGNATSATFILFTGEKSTMLQLVCNAGASTNCGITATLYGNFQNTTTGGEPIGAVTIPTGSATTNGIIPTFKTNYAYYYWITTGVAGTSPVLNAYIHY